MSTLPQWVDPRRLAAAQDSVEGELSLAGLARLSTELYPGDGAGPVVVQLDFAEDDQRRIRVTGRLQARLRLRCQRCLGPADWNAMVRVQVMVVGDDQAAAEVPRDWEPVISEAGMLAPAALVEDELILAQPVVARCNDRACRSRYEGKPEQAAHSDNPFARLAELKRER